MLECLESYDPYKGAEFLTYAHHAIGNALIQCRMMEENGSFASLDEYKRVRGIAWLYNETGKSKGEVVSEYAKKEGCSEETAEQYLTVAQFNRSQVSLYVTAQDEDGEETGEDVTKDDSWDYTAILWNGAQAKAVQTAFEKLTYREQRLLEERNAVCMTCGRVSPIAERKFFEELAVMFEGSTASGAERAYRRAVEKLTVLLVEAGTLHAVRLKRKSVKRTKTKIAAVGHEQEIRVLAAMQLGGAGKAHAVGPGAVDFRKLLRRSTAQALVQWGLLLCLFHLRHPLLHLTGGQLAAELQELIYRYVDVHGVCLPLACGELCVVGGKAQMHLAKGKGVAEAFHEAVAGVFADDLVLVAFVVHFYLHDNN